MTGTVRADARAPIGYELGVTRPAACCTRRRPSIPITPKEHGTALPARAPPPVAALEPPARHPARPRRGRPRVPRVPRRARLPRLRRADPHARRVRGHDHAVPRRVLRRDGLPHAERAALRRGRGAGVRQGLRLRPDLPRREVEDAPPPDRVLDGRAGDGVRRTRRRHGRWPRTSSSTSSGACCERRRAELRALERDARAARARPEAVPAHHLRRGDRTAARRRASTSRGATTSAPTRRPRCPQQFDRPVMVHRYPLASKAFYMKADPADPRLALCVDVLAPEGYGEIIGGGQREDDLATLEARDRRARPAARGVRLVPRSAPLRLRAARRLRHGHRALRRVALRPAPRARDDPVPAHAGTPAPVT